MKRALLAAVAVALAAAATAAAGLPVHRSGSAVGEGLPLKAYASITPTVHLFGDLLTARLAIVADTKWVDPARVSVHTSFTPYVPVHRPQVLRLRSGRFEQITWTWSLRCLSIPCVPRVPPSDRYHVFRFHPAHIAYLTAAGKPEYGLDASWPSVEVLSQVSPGLQRFLQLTNHINWRISVVPMAAPTYRVSPTFLRWLALALATVLGLGALGLAGWWYRGVRPRAAAAATPTGTPLERALAVLRYAHATGDETLERKAFERVADELGVERAAELTRVARELAWSPRSPEDEDVEEFTTRARGAHEES